MTQSYEVEISARARPLFTVGGELSPFADRDASFTVHVKIDDDGIEASAKAIADGIEKAAVIARGYVGPSDRSTAALVSDGL